MVGQCVFFLVRVSIFKKNYFDIGMLKLNFKNKKYYFNKFLNKKYFKK